MRKRKKGKKLSRKRDQRRALLKSLASSLILKKRIKTTEAKAKALRVFVEKIITKAKNSPPLTARREASRYLSKQASQELMKNLLSHFHQRKGGYTRIIKLSPRISDGAPLVFIEFVLSQKTSSKNKKASKS